MHLTRLFLFLVCCLALASCGQKGLNGKKRISLSKSSLQAALDNQTFECASLDGNACPAGVARIFIYNASNPEDSAVCSGFLNGNDRVVTNNHCLSKLDECQNTYVSIYNGTTYENARCKSIIKTQVDPGALNQKGIDFTVMKLDHGISSTTFPLSPYKPYVGERLTTWVMDHLSLNRVRITELNCNFKTRSKSMQLAQCPVISGNSGSPLLNSYAEVVGVIWGSTVDESIDGTMPLSERRALDEYALATELSFFKNYLYSN